jgi:hypothetical protein
MLNNARRSLILFSLALLAALLSGCATEAITRRHTYPEQVSSVLISQDKQKIVFIGQNAHYVFEAPRPLVTALEQPLHSKLSGTLADFHVDAKNVVTGSFSLALALDASEQDRSAAAAIGFRLSDSGQWVLPGTLSGTRYQSRDTEKNMTAQSLNKTYAVELSYDPSTGDKVAEALITPIVVTTEGLFLIYNIVLSPVLVPMGFSKIKASCVPYCMTQDPGKPQP